jgi:uncharacterized coiled-coil protein SlyX
MPNPKPVDAFARIEALEKQLADQDLALKEAAVTCGELARANFALKDELRAANERIDQALDKIAGLRGEVRDGA